MGDMADFALDEVTTEEIFRMEAYYAPMCSEKWWQYVEEYETDPQEPIEELDLGVMDLESMSVDIKLTAASFKGNLLPPNRPQHNRFPKRRLASQKDRLVAHCKKYAKTWEMRIGMAKQVYINGHLSANQRTWMDTNYKGGTKQFINDLSNPEIRDQLLSHLIRFGTWVVLVAKGTDVALASKQSLQYSKKFMSQLK
jgi:hypothetical protein